MSSTFHTRTFSTKTTGSGSLTFKTGYKPSKVYVMQEDGISFEYFLDSPFGTVKNAANGARTKITTTGITWDDTLKAIVLGTDAGLNGTASKILFVEITK